MGKDKTTRISFNLYDEVIKLQDRLKNETNNNNISFIQATDVLAKIMREKNISAGLNIEINNKKRKSRFNFEI